MVGSYFLQADGGFSILQFGDETPVLVFFFQYLATGFKVCVETWNTFPEIFQRTFEEVIRNKEVLFNIFLFQTVSGFTCQNHQFTDHIFSTQVNTWVRFGVAFFLCHFDGTAERNIGADFIKYIVQCTGKHRFNLQNLVTAMNQVINCIDDRKTCTYVCFEQILHTPLAGNRFQFTIVFISGRSRNLIGCYHRDIVLQEIFVKRCDVSAGRTVYKYRIKDIHSDNLVADGLQAAVLALFQQFFTEVGEVETFTAEHCLGCINDAYYMEFQSVFHHQFLLLATNLFYQTAPYRTDTTDKEVQYLIFGEEERIVDYVQ